MSEPTVTGTQTTEENQSEPMEEETVQPSSQTQEIPAEPMEEDENTIKGRQLQEDGQTELLKHNYDAAIALFKQAADLGNIEAKVSEGLAYFQQKDYQRAIDLWKTIDSPRADTLLGVAYFQGAGVEKNEDLCLEHLQRGAAGGEPLAEFNLAIYYYHKDNFEEEYKYCKSAARKGFGSAIARLATLYEQGRGTPKSVENYIYWARKAASTGNATMQFQLGVLYGEGKYGQQRDANEALKWYTLAAESGDARAMNNIGALYQNVPELNPAKALPWYQSAIAADPNYEEPKINIAFLYESGIGVTKDLDQAYKLYSSCEHPNAVLGLARIHTDPANKYYDADKAITLFNSAIDQGAERAAADLLEFKATLKQSTDRALLEKAAKGRNVDAQKKLGKLLEDEKKYEEAFIYYFKAASLDESANALLNSLGHSLEESLFGFA